MIQRSNISVIAGMYQIANLLMKYYGVTHELAYSERMHTLENSIPLDLRDVTCEIIAEFDFFLTSQNVDDVTKNKMKKVIEAFSKVYKTVLESAIFAFRTIRQSGKLKQFMECYCQQRGLSTLTRCGLINEIMLNSIASGSFMNELKRNRDVTTIKPEYISLYMGGSYMSFVWAETLNPMGWNAWFHETFKDRRGEYAYYF